MLITLGISPRHRSGRDADAELVTTMLAAMEPMADLLAASGHYGRRVAVPDDATEQAKLLALSGRQP